MLLSNKFNNFYVIIYPIAKIVFKLTVKEIRELIAIAICYHSLNEQ